MRAPSTDAAAGGARLSAGQAACCLGSTASEPGEMPSVVVVAAHPDDETIGAGALLARLPAVCVLLVTAGAPRDGRFIASAAAARLPRTDYAQLRCREAVAALAVAGLGTGQLERLDFVDQEVSDDMVELARRLAGRFAELAPQIVLTHPYEGGHPDHDAVALAARAAVELLRRRGATAPLLLEMALYHGGSGGLTRGEFLPLSEGAEGAEGAKAAPGAPGKPGALGGATEHIACIATLSPAQRHLKRRMLACYDSQSKVLARFPLAAESFRPAPFYDFAQPPHHGSLWYELQGWPLTGETWRRTAITALGELGLGD